MTLYRKVDDQYVLLSSEEEAAIRADPTKLRAADGDFEIVLPDEEAAAIIAASVPTKDKLKDYAGAARFAKEIGGIIVAGVPILTDRESQALITGAYVSAQRDPAWTCQWKAVGGFVELDAATVTFIAVAVSAYVEVCFAKEAEVVAAIDAETITTLAEIDAAFAEIESEYNPLSPWQP